MEEHMYPFEYYDKLLQQMEYKKAYISSDSITHPLCEELILKHKLHVFGETEVKTIQFASTCKYVILSKGTFSWWIGFLSIYSTVFYPEMENETVWKKDIFDVFSHWNKQRC
jgi:hypothetical protein